MNRQKVAQELMGAAKELEAAERVRRAGWGFEVNEDDDGIPDIREVVKQLKSNNVAADVAFAVRRLYLKHMQKIEDGGKVSGQFETRFSIQGLRGHKYRIVFD